MIQLPYDQLLQVVVVEVEVVVEVVVAEHQYVQALILFVYTEYEHSQHDQYVNEEISHMHVLSDQEIMEREHFL